MEQLSEKLFDFLVHIPKSLYLPIGIGVLGLIFFGVGLIQLFSPAKQHASLPLDSSSAQIPVHISPTIFSGITVDVEGAVLNPGVYSLPTSARVHDALVAAGGLAADADRGIVAKQINLAAKLVDGIKIYIPSVADAQSNVGAVTENSNISQGVVLGAQTGLVNINTASVSQLDNLPGIGPVTAQKIINARPFSSVDDLLAKKAVTKSVFDKIKDKITVQ